MDKWLKPLGFLAILILIFSVIARLLSRGETLAEYAEKNPETAYAAPQKTQMPSPSPSPEPAPSPTSAPTASPVPSEA